MARVVCALRCYSLILGRNSLPDGRLHRLRDDVCHRHQRARLLGNCSGVALPPASMPSWAQARRKFVDQHKTSGSPIALEAIERAAVLYRIEAEAKAMLVEDRHAHRRRHRRFGHAIQPLRDTNQASRRRISRNQGIQNGLANTR